MAQIISIDELQHMPVGTLNEVQIKRFVNYMPMIIKKARTIGCNELTEIEYGFEINGTEGYYILKFDDAIKYEKLY